MARTGRAADRTDGQRPFGKRSSRKTAGRHGGKVFYSFRARDAGSSCCSYRADCGENAERADACRASGSETTRGATCSRETACGEASCYCGYACDDTWNTGCARRPGSRCATETCCSSGTTERSAAEAGSPG